MGRLKVIDNKGSIYRNATRLLLFFAFICTGFNAASAKKVHNRYFKFKIQLPDKLVEIKDSLDDLSDGQLYIDTDADMILMISARNSKFKSVNDYLNCSKKDLEQQLQNDYGDTTFRLINCSVSAFYPKRTTVIYFMVASPSSGNDMHLIYFVHYRKKDIQLWFTYKQATEASSINYISNIMGTFKLL